MVTTQQRQTSVQQQQQQKTSSVVVAQNDHKELEKQNNVLLHDHTLFNIVRSLRKPRWKRQWETFTLDSRFSFEGVLIVINKVNDFRLPRDS